MQYLLLFHCNNFCMKPRQCYVIRTMNVLLKINNSNIRSTRIINSLDTNSKFRTVAMSIIISLLTNNVDYLGTFMTYLGTTYRIRISDCSLITTVRPKSCCIISTNYLKKCYVLFENTSCQGPSVHRASHSHFTNSCNCHAVTACHKK
jgi:hypothetical protein